MGIEMYMAEIQKDPYKCYTVQDVHAVSPHPTTEQLQLKTLYALEVLYHLLGVSGSESHLWPLPRCPVSLVWFHWTKAHAQGAWPGGGPYTFACVSCACIQDIIYYVCKVSVHIYTSHVTLHKNEQKRLIKSLRRHLELSPCSNCLLALSLYPSLFISSFYFTAVDLSSYMR